MSDKKATSNTPFEQEFEKFLRDETTQAGSIYRKLPPAEPDAQLDARVRVLAQRALLDGRASAKHVSRPARRWLPAFASAAVLVLATGIVWRLGPNNWAGQKDAAETRVTASKLPPASMPAPAEPTATGPQNRGANDTTSSDALDSAKSARDTLDSPEAFPSPKQQLPLPPSADARTPGSARRDAKASALPNDASGVAANAPAAAAASNSPLAREKSPTAPSAFAQGELKKREAMAPPASAAAAPAPQAALALGTSAAPEPGAASPAPQDALAQERQSASPAASGGNPATAVLPETASPAPVQPVRSEASAPMPAPSQSPESRQDAVDAAREQEARDEPGSRRPQAAPEVAGRSLDAGSSQALAKRAFVPPPAPPPPPPPPPQSPQSPTEYPSNPLAAAVAAPARSAPEAAMQAPSANQSFADRPPAHVPDFRAYRPTAAQLAAWPAPNCHAAGTVKGENRSWNYPPDVPGTAQLRFATVNMYLEERSREAALKAYADFRHCYPDDHWPTSLLRRLGPQ